jgi:signal transduction histidine kinase
MQQQMQTLITDMRAFCNELRPPVLAPFGLERAIRSHADTFQTAHPEIRLHLNLHYDGKLLPEGLRIALFQVYRESLNNIQKHAQATKVEVRFAMEEERALLEVHDNGVGFHLPSEWVELARHGHLGLVGIQERIEAAGGRVSVNTSPGVGTTLQVVVPLPNPLVPAGSGNGGKKCSGTAAGKASRDESHKRGGADAGKADGNKGSSLKENNLGSYS